MTHPTKARPLPSAAAMVRRLVADERGHDLIEYLLLATFVAIVGYLGIQLLGSNMNTTYRSWDTATQEIWEPEDPVSTP